MHHTKQDIINELSFSAQAIIEALATNDTVTINQCAKHIERIAKLIKDDYEVNYISEVSPTTWEQSLAELNAIN